MTIPGPCLCQGSTFRRETLRDLSHALGLTVVHRGSSIREKASRSDSEPRPLTHSLLSGSQESSTHDTAPPQKCPSSSLSPIPRKIFGPPPLFLSLELLSQTPVPYLLELDTQNNP